MQSELQILGLLKAPDPLLEHQLLAFGDEEERATKQAVRWGWVNRRIKAMDQRTAAERMGIPAPHLSNILNGKKHLPPHKINAYEWIVGNRAVSMTIERFRIIREEEHALALAKAIVSAQGRARAA